MSLKAIHRPNRQQKSAPPVVPPACAAVASECEAQLEAGGAATVLLTPAQVAERLSVTEAALERWRSHGGGPLFVRLSRKTIRYRSNDVDNFVAGCVKANTAED